MLIKLKNNNNGFTLVELLVVMTILAMFAVMMVGILNAIGITNKGRDAQRKKDLNRIKIAFEEYFNDKGYFPKEDVLTQLRDKNNCGKHIDVFPNLNIWPCDPNGNPYYVLTEVDPHTFRVITDLQYKKDKDIPLGWYVRGDFNLPSLGLTTNNANYGVSSSNILWYEGAVRDYSMCNTGVCFDSSTGKHVQDSEGCIDNCYYQSIDPSWEGGVYNPDCWVRCCGVKCDY